jgi:hypothetical protein
MEAYRRAEVYRRWEHANAQAVAAGVTDIRASVFHAQVLDLLNLTEQEVRSMAGLLF